MISRVWILSIMVVLSIIMLFISTYIHVYHKKIVPDNEYFTLLGVIIIVLSLYFITPIKSLIIN